METQTSNKKFHAYNTIPVLGLKEVGWK
jgi:hypothetical protein